MTQDRNPPPDADFWLLWLGSLVALYLLAVAGTAGLELGTAARDSVEASTGPEAAPRFLPAAH